VYNTEFSLNPLPVNDIPRSNDSIGNYRITWWVQAELSVIHVDCNYSRHVLHVEKAQQKSEK
jgi:hypothetical protein